MLNKEDKQLTSTTVWQNIDFKTVQQRLNRITARLEGVLERQSSSQDIGGKEVKTQNSKLKKRISGGSKSLVAEPTSEQDDDSTDVLAKSSQIEAADSIDSLNYPKLRKFMEANQLTESQAIAKIVNTFFSDTPRALNDTPSSPDELLERIAALEQQLADLTGKLRS